MEEETFQLEADDDYFKCCGEVLLTMKGHIVFHCNLCEMKYHEFKKYYEHLRVTHFLETSEYLEQDDDEAMRCESRNNLLNTLETSSTEFNTLDDESTEIIKIEPTLCDDDAAEMKYELDNEETTIEVLDEDAFLISDLLKVDKSTPKYNKLHDEYRRNATSKTISSQKILTKVHHTGNKLKSKNKTKSPQTDDSCEVQFNDSSETTVESHFVPRTNTDELITEDLESVFSAELDPDCYHELPSCDRPTLKRSRKPASSLLDKERKHKCPYCPFASKDKTNLWSHIQRHSNNKPHQCVYCPKNFHTRVELTFHTRYHTGERPFLCTECGRTFVTKEQLKRHMKRHNNERDYKCPDCSKCFFSSQEVREHMAVHSTETPFKCDLCGGVFTRKKALTAHKKLHENKRSYKCKLCDAGFNQSPGLYLHMKTKHQITKRSGVLNVNVTYSENH